MNAQEVLDCIRRNSSVGRQSPIDLYRRGTGNHCTIPADVLKTIAQRSLAAAQGKAAQMVDEGENAQQELALVTETRRLLEWLT